MNKNTPNRRTFIKAAATATGLAIVPRHVLGQGRTAPSDTITRGVVGTGGQGMSHVITNRDDAPPVTLAVCNVDRTHLDNGLRKAGRGCTPYKDFRALLDRKDIDTVHIATPDHWHSLITIAAAQSGKDVYCEKPMTRFIREGQVVIDTINRYGRVMQINSSARAGWDRNRKLVMSGLLGTPLTVYLGPSTDYNWKVKEWSGRRDLTPQPVPDQLDYDFWLGPAPVKPYHPHRVHASFRGYWDYAGGGLSDMGQHYVDPVQYMLGKDDTGPVKVEAYAPPPHHDACGLWGNITITYADGTRIIFESGEWGDRTDGAADRPFLEGPKGRIFRGRRGQISQPAGIWDQLARFPDPPRLISFAECVRTRKKGPGEHPNHEEGHRSVSLLHLANIAIRTGRTISWDPVKQEIIGDREAQGLVNVPMRAPWHL